MHYTGKQTPLQNKGKRVFVSTLAIKNLQGHYFKSKIIAQNILDQGHACICELILDKRLAYL